MKTENTSLVKGKCRKKIELIGLGDSSCSQMITRVSSRNVPMAILVSVNKGTAAMLVSPTNPPGIELYSYTNMFFKLF